MLSFSKCMGFKLIVIIVVVFSSSAQSNNIEFLSKKTIKSLNNNVFEVVVPKLESKKIQYARELPFEKMSYKERNEKYHSIGTAFFINSKELMSAAHVFGLENFSLYKDAYIRSMKGAVYKIKMVKKYSTIHDVIVFDLEEYPEEIAPLKFTTILDIGDTVFSVGNVQGEGISFRAGQIASFTTEPEYGMWKDVRFTAAASPGNSGGPLVNVNGEVVGLIVKKNSSENHNIAVPASVVMKVENKAIFSIKNISVSLNDEQNSLTKDWDVVYTLPKTIKELSKLSQNSLNDFYIQLDSDLTVKYKDLAFPKGKRYRAFLKNQSFVKYFGVLKTDADFKEWSINNYATKTVVIEKNQKMVVGESDLASLHLMLQKPDNSSLSDFLNNPKLIMDNMLKALPLTRSVGEEDVRITSFGEPESTERWQDGLGRKWFSSLWFVPSDGYFVYTHCLPYPKGVICNFDIKNNNELLYGYLNRVKISNNEIAIGYEGDVNDWLEYFSLNKKYLPRGFELSKMSLNNGVFEFTLPNYTVKLANSEINEKSNIHLHLGFLNSDSLEEDLLLFEIFPKKGVKFHYRVQKYFSPGDYSTDENIASWDDLVNKTGDFTGDIINKNGLFSVQNIIDSTKTHADNEIQGLYVVRCKSDVARPKMLDECKRFTENVSFGG